jgi:hypothetical protein
VVRELDIAGAAAAGGWLRWRRKHAVPPGTPCSNCETVLEGPYCHNCGQLAETFERSIVHLLAEGVESFFHIDGRLWRTLPNLAAQPGRLTRNYLDGKRAYQIPPFRLFLVVLLIVFFVGGLNLSGGKTTFNVAKPDGSPIQVNGKTVPMSAQDRKELEEAQRQAKAAGVTLAPSQPSSSTSPMTFDGKPINSPTLKWLSERIKRAVKNPDLFWQRVGDWAHRMAFLMLPLAAFWLSLLFIFQRRFFIFDHLIFSMHSLAFQGLLLSAMFVLVPLTAWAGWLAVLSPVHLFVHMRGTYGSSVFGTLFRMLILFLGSLVGFGLLMLGLLWIGLASMDH